jgi:phosphoribosylformimino-5-aminoimidazole carboxamide ribotide isomerase
MEMMRFRPCIDLLAGRVVQIVGGSLRYDASEDTRLNFTTDLTPAMYARMYQADRLAGGHVIALGLGNRESALQALRAFPRGLQMGGGISPENASEFLNAGASHVIVTSYVFRQGRLDEDRLQALVAAVGKQQLVLDLSCRRLGTEFRIVTDRWQQFTEVSVNRATLAWLAGYCDEFLVHGVDVEGHRLGIDETLVELLGKWSPIPVTYAGGAKALSDLDLVNTLGRGRVDLTIGSALDIFGGDISYEDVVAWQRRQEIG